MLLLAVTEQTELYTPTKLLCTRISVSFALQSAAARMTAHDLKEAREDGKSSDLTKLSKSHVCLQTLTRQSPSVGQTTALPSFQHQLLMPRHEQIRAFHVATVRPCSPFPNDYLLP